MDGEKDVLGIWIGGNETSKFWLSVLTDLKTRGMKYVASGDQKSFAKDLKTIYSSINEDEALNKLLEVKEKCRTGGYTIMTKGRKMKFIYKQHKKSS